MIILLTLVPLVEENIDGRGETGKLYCGSYPGFRTTSGRGFPIR